MVENFRSVRPRLPVKNGKTGRLDSRRGRAAGKEMKNAAHYECAACLNEL